MALDKDLRRKIVTQGLEIVFKYSGQPLTCYRCGSTEHMVKDCPRQRQQRPTRVHTQGEDAGTTPPTPPAPTSEDQEGMETSESSSQPPSTSETPPETAPASQTSTLPASYAAVTQTLFPDSGTPSISRKRAPPSPAKEDKPASKKQPAQVTESPFVRQFTRAMQKSGAERSKLIKAMSGSDFYLSRALFLEHTHGNYSDMGSRAL